jgi:uncharacterized protein (TIGR03435 family)
VHGMCLTALWSICRRKPVRAIALLTVVCSGAAPSGLAQAPVEVPAKLAFDVVSVRPSNSNEAWDSNFPLGPGDVYVPNGGNFTATALPLIVYINFAYKVSSNQAQAIQKQLPGWVTTEKYDIIAKTDNHEATKDEMRLMMRSLLADRFKLAVHNETQQVPVYALVLVKPGTLGPKLVAHPASEPCDNTPKEPPPDTKTPPLFTGAGGFPTICGGILGLDPSDPALMAFGARNVTIGLIANFLTGPGDLGRPVLDRTGLTGKYDFVLEFARDHHPAPGDAANAAAPLDTSGPGIEEALKKQLGLKLASEKGSVDLWIADHVERPTAN